MASTTHYGLAAIGIALLLAVVPGAPAAWAEVEEPPVTTEPTAEPEPDPTTVPEPTDEPEPAPTDPSEPGTIDPELPATPAPSATIPGGSGNGSKVPIHKPSTPRETPVPSPVVAEVPVPSPTPTRTPKPSATSVPVEFIWDTDFSDTDSPATQSTLATIALVASVILASFLGAAAFLYKKFFAGSLPRSPFPRRR